MACPNKHVLALQDNIPELPLIETPRANKQPTHPKHNPNYEITVKPTHQGVRDIALHHKPVLLIELMQTTVEFLFVL
jgi:hypothetical protein